MNRMTKGYVPALMMLMSPWAAAQGLALPQEGTIIRYDLQYVVAADRDYLIDGGTVLLDEENNPVFRQDLFRGQGARVVAATPADDVSAPVALRVIVYDKKSEVE